MSPRAILLDAMVECLSTILVVDGYHTNLGQVATTEPVEIDGEAADAVLGVVLGGQARAEVEALKRTHRLTDVLVVGKVPATHANARDKLDELLTDIERAMDAQQSKFPVGFHFPTFVESQPIPYAKGAGWVGVVVRFRTHIPIR